MAERKKNAIAYNACGIEKRNGTKNIDKQCERDRERQGLVSSENQEARLKNVSGRQTRGGVRR